jgi:hypothetical protein
MWSKFRLREVLGSMSLPLVDLDVVSATGDNTLLLAHFMQTGTVLPRKGRGTALKKSNTKRVVDTLLGVEEGDTPASVDGSLELVNGLAFPGRGFTREIFEVHKERVKAVAEAYAAVGRSEADKTLRRMIDDIEKGFATCDSDRSHVSTTAGNSDLLTQALAQDLGTDCKVVLRKDASGRPRILLHIADRVLKPEYVQTIAGPANRSRQVSEMLKDTKDLRDRWDAAAEGSDLSLKSHALLFLVWVSGHRAGVSADQAFVTADQVFVSTGQVLLSAGQAFVSADQLLRSEV